MSNSEPNINQNCDLSNFCANQSEYANFDSYSNHTQLHPIASEPISQWPSCQVEFNFVHHLPNQQIQLNQLNSCSFYNQSNNTDRSSSNTVPFVDNQLDHVSKCVKSKTKSNLTAIKRRSRQNFTPKQLARLEQVFDQSTHYPDWTTLSELATELKLPAERAQVWFQNRRAKFRRNAHNY